MFILMPTGTGGGKSSLKEDSILAIFVFKMGIDRLDIQYASHYNLSKNLELYYQKIGRAGRRNDGEGKCILLYTNKNRQQLEKYPQNKYILKRETNQHFLEEVKSYYVGSSLCRQKVLLHYFGEKYLPENCDNFSRKTESIEEKKWLLLALKVVKKLKEKFKTDQIVDVLRGEKSTKSIFIDNHTLKIFEKGKTEGKNT